MNDKPKVLSKAEEIPQGFYWEFKVKDKHREVTPVEVCDGGNVYGIAVEYSPGDVEKHLGWGYRYIAIPLPDLSEVDE